MPHQRGRLPGFGLSLGFSLLYLSLLVLIPLGLLLLKPFELGLDRFWASVTSGRVLSAYGVSLSSALIAAVIDLVFGSLTAWVLVRYPFPGRKFFDALVDFPFALPTAVAGVSFAVLFSPIGWFGCLLEPAGIHLINTQAGIVIALIFIGFPFVVRTLQPVLANLEPEWEEAGATLGARRWTVFRRVIFPEVLPAAITGFTLALARGIGEYGSVIFIAGNLPYKTEIAPLAIMAKLDQFDYPGAASVAVVLLLISFIFLLILNGLQSARDRGLA